MSNIVMTRRRPTGYSQAASDRVCEAIATSRLGLKKMTEADGTLPREGTINQWRKLYPDFSDAYDAARERQAEMLLDDCVEIADDRDKDMVPRAAKDGAWEFISNPTNVARAKLQIDTRFKMAGRLAPRKYGKVIVVEAKRKGRPFVRPANLDDLIC